VTTKFHFRVTTRFVTYKEIVRVA